MSDFYNEDLTEKYAAPAAKPRKSFRRWVEARAYHIGTLLLVIGILMVVWSLCQYTTSLAQFVIEGRMTVDAAEIAAERCLHQEGIDAVIVGQYVFECESEESHE